MPDPTLDYRSNLIVVRAETAGAGDTQVLPSIVSIWAITPPARTRVTGVLLSFALVLIATEPAAQGFTSENNTRLYAGQKLGSGTNGLDGYIRHSGVTLQHYPNTAVADRFGLTRIDSNWGGLHWTQVGVFQGRAGVGCPSGPECVSHTGTGIFGENLRPDTIYDLVDGGAPPTPNYPYYIQWNGVSCGQFPTMCAFAHKAGSVLNPPFDWGYMSGSWGVPEAAYESFYPQGTTQREGLNNDYFGLDSNQQINPSFAIHFYSYATNTWFPWTQSAFPSTTCLDNAPLVYIAVQKWTAFRVHDDAGTAECD